MIEPTIELILRRRIFIRNSRKNPACLILWPSSFWPFSIFSIDNLHAHGYSLLPQRKMVIVNEKYLYFYNIMMLKWWWIFYNWTEFMIQYHIVVINMVFSINQTSIVSKWTCFQFIFNTSYGKQIIIYIFNSN